MPSPTIKAMAKKAGKNPKEAEKKWKQAKEITKEELGIKSEKDFVDNNSKGYKYAMGVFKNLMGIKEQIMNKKSKKKSFFEMGMSAMEYIDSIYPGYDDEMTEVDPGYDGPITHRRESKRKVKEARLSRELSEYIDQIKKEVSDYTDRSNAQTVVDSAINVVDNLLDEVEEDDITLNDSIFVDQDKIDELVDGEVDIYYHDLYAWLNQETAEYIERALDEFGYSRGTSFSQVIQQAQSLAISDVVYSIIDYTDELILK